MSYKTIKYKKMPAGLRLVKNTQILYGKTTGYKKVYSHVQSYYVASELLPHTAEADEH